MSDGEKAPLPVVGQWTEARGFKRLYHNNPHYQSRLAKVLIGLREEFLWENNDDENDDSVKAIDNTLATLVELHPEFLEPQSEAESDRDFYLGAYEPDPLLVEYVQRVIVTDE